MKSQIIVSKCIRPSEVFRNSLYKINCILESEQNTSQSKILILANLEQILSPKFTEGCKFTLFIFGWERQETTETLKERQTVIEGQDRICRELTCKNSKAKLDHLCKKVWLNKYNFSSKENSYLSVVLLHQHNHFHAAAILAVTHKWCFFFRFT